MNKIEQLTVKYHDEVVGIISLTPDNKRLAFEYGPHWLAEGFSISPVSLSVMAIIPSYRDSSFAVSITIVCFVIVFSPFLGAL